MIYPASLAIRDFFQAKNINCTIIEPNNLSAVVVGFTGRNVKNILVHFISVNEHNDVSVRIPVLTNVPLDKRSAALNYLNEANIRFRYIKLSLMPGGEVTLTCDVPDSVTNVGEVCFELFIRITRIVEEVYPQLMKTIWADPAVPTVKN